MWGVCGYYWLSLLESFCRCCGICGAKVPVYGLGFFDPAITKPENNHPNGQSHPDLIMRLSTLLACSALGVGLSMAQGSRFRPNVQSTNNPPNVTYTAQLLNKTTTDLRGNVSITSGPGGEGVLISAMFSGFPNETEQGPFPWHVHAQPVNASGDCLSAGPHLSPNLRADAPPCDRTDLVTCQSGDLSGKYGDIGGVRNGTVWTTEFFDPFLSTNPNSTSFVGNRSIVVHLYNGTRINCGNFTLNPNGSQAFPPVFTLQLPGRSSSGASRVGAVALGVILASIIALLL
ncbi:Cu-Zn superoxide dismutase [Histoplasma capsulatum G186AR]|uniref:Cu-Zn superoxide dismutase n=1 Tax=Ajellomyces capsulatus (strain G186AR / H82 / ATCC MYA-2454 / RMSCC 2432) TaxID=447093 RepID=C0NKH0_AJECG|nr:Cu-Zn superoxide dismutase [Histoplasma capsulatum G186AR]EEH08361.1 Cu-Zn superoxide dismutase [Histoplasma capsulatum G186AR]